MTTTWPAWVSWLLLLSVVATLIIVWMLAAGLGAVRNTLVSAGFGPGAVPARNRQELEELYTRGKVNRDVYDAWKGRLK